MDININDDKRAAAARYSRLAFIFGIISLAGLVCCFPIMPVVGGLGIVFAVISRGGANVFSPEAKKGLTFSLIGSIASVILTVAVMAGSVIYTMNELKTNPGILDEMRQMYEQMYDSMGQEVPPELLETLDRMEEYSEELNRR
ncbi:MAG: hypothetical protein K6A71_05845 [Lachnospiraceae bacterium]|nr:hypothetical protein [Lachnospiraceae bacterium]